MVPKYAGLDGGTEAQSKRRCRIPMLSVDIPEEDLMGEYDILVAE
jgi:hypothetical protein